MSYRSQRWAQNGKHAHDGQIIWWTKVNAIVGHHAHDKRLYSLELGEAKCQAATDDRVFGWYVFWVHRTGNRGESVDGLSLYATNSARKVLTAARRRMIRQEKC